ncbi:hypothetical protein ACFOSV_16190 [Algoriphagus namhaensis]|uniref:DUF4239 domain-containing protein n=1 Tax=Algoriphagus namhaensis TaxID=915353 RepID=A0ABV8AXP8_9BACT
MELFKFFFEVPLILGMMLFVSIAVSTSLLIYYWSHRLMAAHLKKEHERAGRVLFRNSAGLLALILSFTFANDRIIYYQIKDSLVGEASRIVDMYMDLEEYNTPEASQVNQNILSYVNLMVDEDYIIADGNPFATATMREFRKIYQGIHDLTPTTEKQKYLVQDLYSDLDGLSDNMQVRVYQSNNRGNYVFYILLAGLFVMMIIFGIYKPDKFNLLFLGLYSGFISSVIFFMILLSEPFQGPLKIQPEPFLILKQAVDNRE